MRRRLPVAMIACLAAGTAAWSGRSAAAERPDPPPNVLLMYVDNVGYGDLGCYGNTEVLTPRIDRLAAEGARCTDFYVVTTSCTPSRGAILTGRYPARNGLQHQLSGAEENWHGIGLPHRERIIPQYLREAGYATGCFGKWNIGFAPGSRPTERGFDEFLGFRSGNIGYFDHLYAGVPDLFRDLEPLDAEGYSTDLFADAAIDFIRRRRDGPWFAYLAFNAVHFVNEGNVPPGRRPTWEVPGAVLARYGWQADEPDERRRYLGVLTALDDAIGRVLDELDRQGLRERTLVILISDNGAFMMPGRGLEVASNKPLRGGGTTCFEGGTRVPAIMRWPGRIPPATVVREMLSHLDVLPLLIRASGAPTIPGRVLDGRDPLPTLAGTAPTPHASLVFSYGKAAALREGTLKIVRPRPDAAWALHDLATDLGECHDLAASRPADLARLVAAFAAWEADVRRDASPGADRPP